MRQRLLGMLWITGAAVALAAPAPAQERAAVVDWQAPVPGEPLRRFDAGAHPFSAGAHRGVDLAASPGAPVAATCAGRVAFAGEVARSRVVTLACGRWRVTHLPLRDVSVAAGERVRRGGLLGTVAAGGAHAGLHVGIRREGDRWGYVDPWPLMRRPAGDRPGPVPAPPPRARRVARQRPPARPARGPRGAARPRRLPTAPGGASRGDLGERSAIRQHPAPLASPLAWAGLALVLVGLVRKRHRRGRVPIRLRAKEPATRTR